MNKNLRGVLLLGGFALLLVVVWSLLVREKAVIYSTSKPIAGNMQRPFFSDNKIMYFTGSSFASYDAASNKTSRLSPIYHLPDVKNVQWSSRGALFEADSYTPVDDLYKLLLAQGLSTDRPYWWLFDLKTKQLYLLQDPATSRPVKTAAWGSGPAANDVFFATERKGDEIYNTEVFRLIPGQTASRAESYQGGALLSFVWTDGKTFVFEERDNKATRLIRIDSSKKAATLAENIMPGTSASPSGTLFTLHKQEHTKLEEAGVEVSPSDLYLLNTSIQKETRVAESFNANVSWNSKHNGFVGAAISEGRQQVVLIRADKKPVFFRSAKNAKDEEELQAAYLISLDDPQLWATDIHNNLLKLDAEPANYPEKHSDRALHGDFYENGFYINYLPKTNSYNIYITQNPYSANQQKALEYIQDQGVDPNQIEIKWYAYDKVDRSK